MDMENENINIIINNKFDLEQFIELYHEDINKYNNFTEIIINNFTDIIIDNDSEEDDNDLLMFNLLKNIITSFERNVNEPFIGQYGFQDETTSMKQMAMLYYAVNPGKYKIASTKTADGKSKYSYIQPSYVERIKRDWKNGNTGFLVNSEIGRAHV